VAEDVNVDLTWRELRHAALAGIDRRLHDLYKKCKDRNGAPSRDLGWQLDIEGCIGEIVLAKGFGLYWPGAAPQSPLGDVGPYQVRYTQHLDGCLIVYRDNSDDAAYILVVGHGQHYRIVGWIRGGDAKQERWWNPKAHGPGYFVPQSALHPLSELPGYPHAA
jgi:hypothetical protein